MKLNCHSLFRQKVIPGLSWNDNIPNNYINICGERILFLYGTISYCMFLSSLLVLNLSTAAGQPKDEGGNKHLCRFFFLVLKFWCCDAKFWFAYSGKVSLWRKATLKEISEMKRSSFNSRYLPLAFSRWGYNHLHCSPEWLLLSCTAWANLVYL